MHSTSIVEHAVLTTCQFVQCNSNSPVYDQKVSHVIFLSRHIWHHDPSKLAEVRSRQPNVLTPLFVVKTCADDIVGPDSGEPCQPSCNLFLWRCSAVQSCKKLRSIISYTNDTNILTKYLISLQSQGAYVIPTVTAPFPYFFLLHML